MAGKSKWQTIFIPSNNQSLIWWDKVQEWAIMEENETKDWEKQKVQVNVITSGTTSSLWTIKNLPQDYRFKVLFPCMSLFHNWTFLLNFRVLFSNNSSSSKTPKTETNGTCSILTDWWRFWKFHIWKSAQSCFQFSFPTLFCNYHCKKEVRVWLTLNCSSTIRHLWRAQSQEISRCKSHNCFYIN